MRRSLTSLALAAAAAVALTGCVIAAPSDDPFDYGYLGGYDPSTDDFDPEMEEAWLEEDITWQLEHAASVAEELRAIGSDLAPAEGESLSEFRHVVLGAGWEWCDRLYIDPGVRGDMDAHAERAAEYGWSADEHRIIAEAAEAELCV